MPYTAKDHMPNHSMGRAQKSTLLKWIFAWAIMLALNWLSVDTDAVIPWPSKAFACPSIRFGSTSFDLLGSMLRQGSTKGLRACALGIQP